VDGTFRPRVEYPVSDQTQALTAGAFDGDGALDLLVTINTESIGLSLLTGRGHGTFNPAVSFPNAAGFDAPSIVAVDLDNDGRLDAGLGHQISCYRAPCIPSRIITVMRGNGNGTIQPPRHIPPNSSRPNISDRCAVGDGRGDWI
jgi:hypothetical protein